MFHSIRTRFLLTAVLGVVLALGTAPLNAKEAAPAKALVDLNAASQKDLEGLKGVGAATAKKIIAARPIKSWDDLEKAGVSKKTVAALKSTATIGAAAPDAPAAVAGAGASAAGKPKTVAKDTGKKDAAKTELVNINTADEKTLASLKGVGSKTAKAIMAGRPYKSLDDLGKVKGIGDKKLASLKPFITLGDTKTAEKTASAPPAPSAPSAPTAPSAPADKGSEASSSAISSSASKTSGKSAEAKSTAGKLAAGQMINLNTATLAELELLPDIGKVKGQAIIDYRTANGRFNAIEDVMKVTGIKEGIFAKIKDHITVR